MARVAFVVLWFLSPCCLPRVECQDNIAACAAQNYLILEDQKDFVEARRYCRKQNQELVTFESVYEEEVMAQLLLKRHFIGKVFYAGASNRHSRGDMRWEATGVSLLTGHANENSQVGEKECFPADSCLTIKSRFTTGINVDLEWKFINCSIPHSYICQKITVECSLPVKVKSSDIGDSEVDTYEALQAQPAPPAQEEPDLRKCFVISHCKASLSEGSQKCLKGGYGDLATIEKFLEAALIKKMLQELALDEEFYTGIGLEELRGARNESKRHKRQSSATVAILRSGSGSSGSSFSVQSTNDLRKRRFLCQSKVSDCKQLLRE